MTNNGTIDFMPALSQEFLGEMWLELRLARQMTSSFPHPNDSEAFFMVTAFGDAIENALYLQPMQGDTLFEEPASQQVVYVRKRSSLEDAWSVWIRQSDGRS